MCRSIESTAYCAVAPPKSPQGKRQPYLLLHSQHKCRRTQAAQPWVSNKKSSTGCYSGSLYDLNTITKDQCDIYYVLTDPLKSLFYLKMCFPLNRRVWGGGWFGTIGHFVNQRYRSRDRVQYNHSHRVSTAPRGPLYFVTFPLQ